MTENHRAPVNDAKMVKSNSGHWVSRKTLAITKRITRAKADVTMKGPYLNVKTSARRLRG